MEVETSDVAPEQPLSPERDPGLVRRLKFVEKTPNTLVTPRQIVPAEADSHNMRVILRVRPLVNGNKNVIQIVSDCKAKFVAPEVRICDKW